MIRLFRNLRKSVLYREDTGKYLKYALGETILVVVGILIALQVNNWSSKQKEKKKEQIHLIKLASNLQDDISLFREIILGDSLMSESLKRVSNEILRADNIDDVDFRDNARFKVNLFYPNKTAFDNLVSSGQLDLIGNDIIVENLLLYYRSITIASEGIDYSLRNYSRDIEHFFIGFDHVKQHDFLRTKTIEDYRKDPFILNSFYYKNGLLYFQIRNYRELMAKAMEILDLVNSELINNSH